MNCNEVRERLPLHLCDDPKPEETAALQEHLRGCAECRRRHDELQQTRTLLDIAPVPEVQVDLPRLYRQAAEQQERRLRRWRRTAIAALTTAAVILLVLGLRLEVRLEGHQVTLRWGNPPALPEPAPTPLPPAVAERLPADPFVTAQLFDMEARLRILTELTELIAKRDQGQQQDLTKLQKELQDLQRQTNHWQFATERDVAALYAGLFSTIKKGTTP